MSLPTPTTQIGDWVKVCHHAKRGDMVKAPPIIPAKLSGPLRVTGIWKHGVRIGGDSVNTGSWHSSWVRIVRREDESRDLSVGP